MYTQIILIIFFKYIFPKNNITFPIEHTIYNNPYIKLCLGNPKQCFNFKIITNVEISYIIDYKYNNGGFNSEKSTTYKQIKNNYSEYYDEIGGRLLNGLFSSDILSDLNDTFILKEFRFYLISSGYYSPQIDGVIGLSRNLNSDSFLKQLYDQDIIPNYNFALISNKLIIGNFNEEFRNFGKLIFTKNYLYESSLIRILFYNLNFYFSIENITSASFSPGAEVIFCPSFLYNKLIGTIFKSFILKKQCIVNQINDNSSFLVCFKGIINENLGKIYFIFGKWNINFELNKLFFKYNEEKFKFGIIGMKNINKIILGYPFFFKYDIIFDNHNEIVIIKQKK